ncbi:MAG: metallophosphoesterase family protein [Bacillota bacterium]
MIKFLHCADLHLDSPFKGLSSLPERLFQRLFDSTFVSFKRLIDLAISEEVDFVVIAGDLYDSGNRSLKAQSFLKNCFMKLNSHNINVYVVHGNHDPLDGQWVDLEWPSNVRFFDGSQIQTLHFEKQERVVAALHGFSYETAAVTDDRTLHYPEKRDDLYHIGILHGQADGYSGHSRYAPFLLTELLKKGYDYWALGHIHKRIDLNLEPPVRYSGNIQGRHSGELGEKGGYIVTLNHNEVKSQFYSTSEIDWQECRVDLTEVDSLQEVIFLCEKKISTYLQQNKGVLLVLKLSGQTQLYHELLDGTFIEDLEEILREEDYDSSFVHVVAIKNVTSPSLQEEQSMKQSAFFQDLQSILEDEIELHIAISELSTHRTARKYIELNEQDLEDIKQQAEQLLLSELHKNR